MPKGVPKTELEIQLLGTKIVQAISLGRSMREAARACEIDDKTAMLIYRKQLASTVDLYSKKEMLAQELATLEVMQRGLMPRAMKGDPQAVRAMIALMAKRSEYLGLDEAVKVQIDVKTVNEAIRDVVGVIDGELAPVQPLRRIEPKSA